MSKHMVTSVVDKWLSRFFDETNNWPLSEAQKKNYPDRFKDSLGIMLEQTLEESLPAILPRWQEHNNKHLFYIVANDFRQLGELRGIVRSVFGETYLSYSQIIIKLADDEKEELLLQKYPCGFLRLEVHDCFNIKEEVIAQLMTSLNEILSRYLEKPLFRSTVKRPTARILRDFQNAINFGDGTSALTLKKELQSRKLLSPMNLISLELQALATSNLWPDILSDKSRLRDVLSSDTSWRVKSIILRALRVTSLDSSIIESHASVEVVSKYADLQQIFFKSPNLPHESIYDEEWVCWSIGATAFGFDGVYTTLPERFINNGWAQQLKNWVSPDAALGGDDLLVLDKELLGEPSIDLAWSMLQESLNASMDEQKAVYGVISNYPEDIVDSLLADEDKAFIWAHFIGRYEQKCSLSGWSDVLKEINKNTPLEEIQEELGGCIVKWGIKEWDNKILQSLIQNENTSAMRDILPQILSWLHSHSISISKDNSLEILLSLASDDARSPQDIVLCGDLIRGLTNLPLLPEEYIDALDYVQEVWGGDIGAVSLYAVNYYLDLIDVIADAACVVPDRREKLWNIFQEFLIKQWTKLDEAQKLSVVKLAEDLTGTSTQFPSVYDDQEFEVPRKFIDLSGHQLAIYSLTEGAGRRAKSVISNKYPGLGIILNHDKTATSSLINLADKADYFVFAAKSAAHQAFYPVADRRKDLIYPGGKGSTSIIRAFVEYIDGAL